MERYYYYYYYYLLYYTVLVVVGILHCMLKDLGPVGIKIEVF